VIVVVISKCPVLSIMPEPTGVAPPSAYKVIDKLGCPVPLTSMVAPFAGWLTSVVMTGAEGKTLMEKVLDGVLNRFAESNVAAVSVCTPLARPADVVNWN